MANSATVGSGLTSYADDNSNSRTITDLIWMDNTYTNTSDPNYSAGTNGDILFMALDGTGIPNTNDTFYSIIVNGVTLLRSDAQAATGNSNTVWIWRLTSSNLTTLGTTGSKTLVIKSSSGTAVNDGIINPGKIFRDEVAKLIRFDKIFIKLKYKTFQNTSFSARGEQNSTGDSGVHGTFNSKVHYVTVRDVFETGFLS